MGIVQFTNYLRPMQFITLVSILNERLKLLDDKIVKIKNQSDSDDEKFNFNYSSTSTMVFDKIEVYRETFAKVWKLHVLLNHCFGMSILVITLNAFLSVAFTLYYAILDHSTNVPMEILTQPMVHTCHIAAFFVVLVTSCDKCNDIVSKYVIIMYSTV
jgi:7tm Chemosensory receptor